MPTIDFPIDVSDTSPTFLVGGNADIGNGIPSVALVGAAGRAVLATATPSEAQTAIGLGLVFAISADTVMADVHNGGTLVMSGSHLLTIDDDLPAGFGCAIKGDFTYGGTAIVTDVRESGASNPWCALVQTGTDAYDLVGNKA